MPENSETLIYNQVCEWMLPDKIVMSSLRSLFPELELKVAEMPHLSFWGIKMWKNFISYCGQQVSLTLKTVRALNTIF